MIFSLFVIVCKYLHSVIKCLFFAVDFVCELACHENLPEGRNDIYISRAMLRFLHGLKSPVVMGQWVAVSSALASDFPVERLRAAQRQTSKVGSVVPAKAFCNIYPNARRSFEMDSSGIFDD
jgi:hypothetical protein